MTKRSPNSKLVQMKLFSAKSFLEVVSGIFVNLTSGWFGVLLVVPGFLKDLSLQEYIQLLTQNLPFGLVGLIISIILTEKSKSI